MARPIGIDDVLTYVAAALHLPDGESRTFEIGGADRASYGDVMREYARQRGLRRVMLSVPPDGGGTLVHQTAVFEPTGLFGLLYRYGLLPVHHVIFEGMLREIGRRGQDGRV